MVFGELSECNYSGIGISCGSGLCNVCLAVLSVPVISFSVAKAGDFIDTQASLVTGEMATRLRVQKEQAFQLNGLNGERVQNALTVYYREVIRNLIETLRQHIASRAAPAQAGSIRPIGALRRHRHAARFPGILRLRAARQRIPRAPFGSPPVRRPAQFDRPRRADGRTLLGDRSPSRLVGQDAILRGDCQPPRGPIGNRTAACQAAPPRYATRTVLMLTNSRRPWAASSRP